MDVRALIFVPALVGCVVFGFVFALFAAHYYLTVMQSTGSGAKSVVYVSEPLLDHFWKVFYLMWLIGLWLAPAWFLGRAVAARTDTAWMRYAVPLAAFWICYPFSQLSSLSGPSIWYPLHPDAFGRLARKPHAVLGFLILSGGTIAMMGVGFHWTFIKPGPHWLFLGSVLFVATALLYARLLGRLAFALTFTRSIFRRKKKRAPVSQEKRNANPADRQMVSAAAADVGFEQPSDLPPIETPDDGPLTGYDVKFDGERPRKRKRVLAEVAEPKAKPQSDSPPKLDDDGDEVAYGVHEPEVQPEERAPTAVVQPSESEMRLHSRDGAPKPTKRVWKAEVFAFLVQPETLTVIGLLAVLCMMAGGMVRIAREFNPVADP